MFRPFAIAIALVLTTAGCAGAAEKNFDKTFTVPANGSLVVDADSASVKISGSDANQVTVHMHANASEEDLATARMDASQKDGEVTVTMRNSGKSGWFGHSWHGDTHIEVTVPRNFSINAH